MNQSPKYDNKYPTKGMDKYSKTMVKYQQNNPTIIRTKGQQQTTTTESSSLESIFPVFLRNTSTVLRPPPHPSARRRRSSSTEHAQPFNTTAVALRNSSADYIVSPRTSARSNPFPDSRILSRHEEICFQRANQTQNTPILHQIRDQKHGNPNHQWSYNTRQKIKMKSNK